MKKLILSAAFLAATTVSFAQIGIGTNTPDPSAALDVTSTTQGVLLPRLTQAALTGMASPAEGLMAYCTDCTPKGVYQYDGSNFVEQVPLGTNQRLTNAAMTTLQGELVANTAPAGAVVYCTDCSPAGDYTFDGTTFNLTTAFPVVLP